MTRQTDGLIQEPQDEYIIQPELEDRSAAGTKQRDLTQGDIGYARDEVHTGIERVHDRSRSSPAPGPVPLHAGPDPAPLQP